MRSDETSAKAVDWAVDPGRVSVVIPTLNAGPYLAELLPALAAQGLATAQFLVVDSESTDTTCEAFRAFGATVVGIERRTFNHGGTRQRAVEMRPDAAVVVMLTQDAIPQGGDALRRLVGAFVDPTVGMAYGRQLPRSVARGIERHARLMNYPLQSETRSLDDRRTVGVKTVFCSDSFAAYRVEALTAVGGFPDDAFFAEDQLVAGRMLMEGWRIAYRGDAEVVHSHGYTVAEEFRRYFDVGVFHGRNRWLTLSAPRKGRGCALSDPNSAICCATIQSSCRPPSCGRSRNMPAIRSARARPGCRAGGSSGSPCNPSTGDSVANRDLPSSEISP